jgi:hypothetical protein
LFVNDPDEDTVSTCNKVHRFVGNPLHQHHGVGRAPDQFLKASSVDHEGSPFQRTSKKKAAKVSVCRA